MKNLSVLLSILLSVLFLYSPVHAELEGEYELISGPEKYCDSGSLEARFLDEEQLKYYVFGGRDTWVLDMSGAFETTEVNKFGCTYRYQYEESENRLMYTMTLSDCPNKEENGVSSKNLILKGNRLTYEFDTKDTGVKKIDSKKLKFKCQYKKVAQASAESDELKKLIAQTRKAAKGGDVEAQLELARRYSKEGEDYRNAFYWCMQAAEQGNKVAQLMLGDMYSNNEYRDKKDYVKAYAWYSLAGIQDDYSVKGRDSAAKKLTPVQLGEAQALAVKLQAKIDKQKK
jgi:hypothetical protein